MRYIIIVFLGLFLSNVNAAFNDDCLIYTIEFERKSCELSKPIKASEIKGDYSEYYDIDFNTSQLAVKNSFNGWEFISCRKDRFDHSKFCAIKKSNLIVSIFNGKSGILVGGNHFPGKKSAIKIDNKQSFIGKEGEFKNENSIISQLIKGDMAYTRYIEWPYNYHIDDEISLVGFNEAYQELKKRYAALR